MQRLVSDVLPGIYLIMHEVCDSDFCKIWE